MAEQQLSNRKFEEYLEGIFGPLCSSVIELLERAAAEAPDRAAILEPGRESLTYAGLLQLAHRTVSVLNGMGFSPRSRLALVLPNTGAAAAAYLSVMAGMTIVPMNTALLAEDYKRSFKVLRVDGVVVQSGTVEAAVAAARELNLPVIDLLVGRDGPVGHYQIWGAGTVMDGPVIFAQPEDVAASMLTSGTTTVPKVVPRTQKQLAMYFYATALQFQPFGGVTINQMPLHHTTGFTFLMLTVVAISGVTCLPGFDVTEIYRYLIQYQPAWFGALPAMLKALVSEAPQHRAYVEQLKTQRIVTFSAALPAPLLDEVHAVFGVSIQLYYGSTELGGIASIIRSPGLPISRIGSIGRPDPFVQLQISDEDGAPLPAGETGEVLVLSPLLFSGYENNPEANAESFHDGWFRTGDAGYLDSDGYLYLMGRIKDVINRGGTKISPLDVESAILRHPAVREAAAFGFPHAVLGEDLAVAIVLQGASVTEDELRLFAFRSLPPTGVPSRFVFVDGLPKTALGKIKRNALAERFANLLRR